MNELEDLAAQTLEAVRTKLIATEQTASVNLRRALRDGNVEQVLDSVKFIHAASEERDTLEKVAREMGLEFDSDL